MLFRYYSLFICFHLLVCIVEGAIFLQANNQACKKQGTNTLFCDFENSNENIELGEIDPKLANFKFATIAIHNANAVAVAKSMCYDLIFKQIGSIQFLTDSACANKAHSLTITDSHVNRVPRKLSKLTVVNSQLETLNCDLGLSRLLLTQSVVGSLNVALPMAGVSYLTIEHTVVENFAKLSLQQKTTLNLLNATVSTIDKEALSVGDGATLFMNDCTIGKAKTPAVVLKPGSKFIVKNLIGSLPVFSKTPGIEDIDGKRPPGVPAQKEVIPPDDESAQAKLIWDDEDCLCPSAAWWIVPTVIAVGEALLILYVFGSGKRPSSLFKMAGVKDSENGYDNFNVNVQGSPAGYNSYYNSGPQYPNDPTLRRR